MLLLAYAFNELGLNKVEWCAIGYNERSINCAKKCGAELVGVSKRHIWREGQWHDEVILEVTDDYIDRAQELTLEAMRGAASLNVPLDVNVSWGRSWAEGME